MGYKLKKEQQKSILELVSGKDVFVCLLTGYGKSLCYTLLPYVFDRIRSVQHTSIILVVSPLAALMKDQVTSLSKIGISATYVTDIEAVGKSKKREIENGEYQIVFVSPEVLFCGTEWKRLLCTDIYLVAFIVVEAHCIKDWCVIQYYTYYTGV